MLAILMAAALAGIAADADPVSPLITVTGILPASLDDVAGSAFVIDAADIAAMQPITVKDVLRRAPGIQIIDEDALGLKLNISVRGLNARRSGRTLLLEDGAPLQPAPYADPSAHHYPSLDRIARIEIRKGSGQILFGPQSIGGAIDFVTLPVPDAPLLSGSLAGGGRGFGKLQAAAGLGNGHSGVRLDAVAITSPGIREGHGTDLGEIAFKAASDVAVGHRLTIKADWRAERGRLTEAGLDDARFAANPYANVFADDRFTLDRWSAQLIHEGELAPTISLVTNAYVADTFRASYRQTDTSTDAMTANPATGCTGAARTNYEGFASRCGNKMRPRRFRFVGVAPRLDLGYGDAARGGAVQIGVRFHHEAVRRQRYNGLTADARETSPGTLLRDDNEINTDALALHAQNRLDLGRFSLLAGARLEDIITRNRALVANFAPVGVAARSHQRLWLPGAGLTWRGDGITAFAGVHRGFAPPRPDRDVNPLVLATPVRPERSTEIELGVRGNHPGLRYDLTLFDMALEDLIVDGPLVGGRSGSFVNAGTARHQGLEASGRLETGRFHASLSWTWLARARFTSEVGDSSLGVRGNRIPYAPEHLIDLAIGATTRDGLSAEIGLNHVSRQFGNADNRTSTAADGQSGVVPARTLLRAAFGYAPTAARWSLFASIENLGDTRYISSRIDGLFAGQRRQWLIGVRTRV